MQPHPKAPACFCAIAIMAKASRAGAVKTRLVPPLAADEAAALNTSFLKDIASNIAAASATADIRGYAAYSPPGSEAFFADLLPPGFGLLAPRNAGLGRSLRDAAEELLGAGHAAVCLVNSDSPTLPTVALLDAVAALRLPGDRVVLGPAADGGYYLIGMKRRHDRLFEGIDWSTERVFTQTLDRASSLGLEVVVLPLWYDVDDAASLRRLYTELFSGRTGRAQGLAGYPAPHSAACLRKLIAAGLTVETGETAA